MRVGDVGAGQRHARDRRAHVDDRRPADQQPDVLASASDGGRRGGRHGRSPAARGLRPEHGAAADRESRIDAAPTCRTGARVTTVNR